MNNTLNNMKSSFGKVRNSVLNNVKKISPNQYYLHLFLIVLIIIITILLIMYVTNEIRKKNTNISTMKKDLDAVDKNITNINFNDAVNQHNLRDYYIMSSYNSCCDGNFENGYVSIDALKQVIFRGARVLDFEIYSLDNKTVVAASYNNNYYQKGTYNSLNFEDVMDIIERYSFAASTAPNYSDPLILHFRIKSNQSHVYKDMAKILASKFNNHKLSSKYNYESGGENIGSEPLENFKNKVIFVCDKENNMFQGTELDELINFTSGSVFLQSLRNYDVLYAPNGSTLIEENKKNMAISMPDLTSNDNNIDAGTHFKYGCQLVCMNFQNVDNNLIFYLEQFNEANSAFILKPAELRFIPKFAKVPQKQDPKVSYAPKVIKKPYFNHEI
jgi:hypothetical protein